MSTPPLPDIPFEPERYELYERSHHVPDLNRRDFFKALGGGIVIVLLLDEALAQESGRRGSGGRAAQEISAWLHIGEDGVVTVYTGKAEMGQNIRTSLAQAVAEELRVPFGAVRMVMGDTQLTPYDAGTFGSQSTPSMSPQLRRVASTAREVLIDLAAEQWKVDRNTLSADDARVTRADTKQSITYADLTKGRKLTKAVSAGIALTPAEQWKIAGHSAPKANGRDYVTGKHSYSSDVKLPGMLYGKVLRPPAFGATLDSLDTKEAAALPGVKVVRDGDFVGVTAPNTHIATQAIAAIHAEWKTKSQASGKDLFDLLKKESTPSSGRGGSSAQSAGSMEDGPAASGTKLRQTYTVAYIAHAPLEPRAAVAQWEGDKLTVWAGTQRPFGYRSELAHAFGISEENVRVITPDTGSGYGGKHTGEAAVEAARLARAARQPVKLVWTREEEFTWAYFRPAGVVEITSGLREDGTLSAWEFHNYNSGSAGIRTPYEVPNQRVAFHASPSPLRQGSYRALASTANHFARETHMDELARVAKLDPLEFRLKNLKDDRLRAVLEGAAKAFGWGRTKPVKDHGHGIAGGFEKGGYVATCAEVSVDRATGKVKVLRAVTAFECGAVVNPNHLKNQIEGALVMGLGGALFEAIQFENGKILNPRFSEYRVPRFDDAPAIEVVLIDRKDLKSAGAGEAPIIGVAPAVGNAIFDATGIRLRSLPMVPDGLKS